jgi:hypothetical protein
MRHRLCILIMLIISPPIFALNENEQLKKEIELLQKQTQALQTQLTQLQKRLNTPTRESEGRGAIYSKTVKLNNLSKSNITSSKSNTIPSPKAKRDVVQPFHVQQVSVHAPDAHPESLEFYPTALVADEHIVTYIAGTPVVTSPYLGSRPAFDGSDYIVNISSINRDIRLMQQRRRLDRAYESIGYDTPQVPIIALSGKVEPIASARRPYLGKSSGDINLGSSELDIAAILNDTVEAYMGIAYDDSPPDDWGQRVANSSFGLNMGFVNIGNLDKTPLYLTAGQLYVPFGRFSTSMVSAPLTMVMARTKSRPFILGYKSQENTGPFAALYGYNSDTALNNSAAGGVNVGYIYDIHNFTGEIGASVISSINDSSGMQDTGSLPGTTFGGFASPTNGSESVKKIPGAGVHYNLSFDRYTFTAEWVTAAAHFRYQDLSFNGQGARPQAGQLEAGITFMSFVRPSSFALGYQWTQQALALNLPSNRISGVYNISIWKDTVESLEFRHDRDYKVSQYANGASATDVINQNAIGTGGTSNTLLAQIGVYF